MAILHDVMGGAIRDRCHGLRIRAKTSQMTARGTMQGWNMMHWWRRRSIALAVVTTVLTAATPQAARSEDQAPAKATPAAVTPAGVTPAAATPAAVTPAAVTPAATPPATATATAAVPPRTDCPSAKFRVVIDVGHALDAPGALSARGVTEYAFNLQLGQNIKQALVDAGFAKTTLLITNKKPPLGLFARASAANGMAADLFLSIHHDSVPDNLVKKWQYEGQDQDYNDDYPGYAIFISKDNAHPKGSLEFGHLLGKALQAHGLQFTPHYTLKIMGSHRRELLDADGGVYRFDQLVVLRYTHMPAALLEAGSIVNRQEELELATPERRAATSAAVVAAVEEFCASRSHPQIEPVAKRPANPHAASPRATAR